MGVGNRLLLAEEALVANARAIQAHNDIEVADPGAALEAWICLTGPSIRRAVVHTSGGDGDRHGQDLCLPAHNL